MLGIFWRICLIFVCRLPWFLLGGPIGTDCIYSQFHRDLFVDPGHVVPLIDEDNNFIFAKPGIHHYSDMYLKVFPQMDLQSVVKVSHGNRTIVTVPQGYIGYAEDMGQPVLLPPGMHSWTSETMKVKNLKLLDDHVITIGPYTIVTVDEGYSAITQNNGLQVVLDGGETHLLTHQKWRFEKFMTQKIQTDDLAEISAASADNVIMSVDSTVVWRIKDVRLAAVSAAETMAREFAGGEVSADIVKLRKDVLKQATASLASFIGSVNYSDSFHMAAAAQRNVETVYAVPIDQLPADVHDTSNPMFDTEGMSEAVSHANQIVSKFGIEILSINIISANPVDANLTRALATGAVASAEALQAETQARGNAKVKRIVADTFAITRKIDTDSEAESILIRANVDAVAEMIRAEGHKHAELLRAGASRDAAVMLETSEVAVALENTEEFMVEEFMTSNRMPTL